MFKNLKYYRIDTFHWWIMASFTLASLITYGAIGGIITILAFVLLLFMSFLMQEAKNPRNFKGYVEPVPQYEEDYIDW